MPIALLPILISIGKWFLHQISRFWGVVLVGLLVFLVYSKYTGFKFKQYEIGYKAGYSQAIHDHPPITAESGSTVNLNQDPTGLIINVWKVHLGGWWK